MEIFINIMLVAALIFVVATLVLSALNMGGSTPEAKEKYNKFLRLRVWGQAIAIGMLMLGFYIKAKSRGQ